LGFPWRPDFLYFHGYEIRNSCAGLGVGGAGGWANPQLRINIVARTREATRQEVSKSAVIGEGGEIQESYLMGQGQAGEPSGRPGGLEIEAARDAIQIKKFTREEEPGTNSAFHRLEIYFF
jgi:hypothetical protein